MFKKLGDITLIELLLAIGIGAGFWFFGITFGVIVLLLVGVFGLILA